MRNMAFRQLIAVLSAIALLFTSAFAAFAEDLAALSLDVEIDDGLTSETASSDPDCDADDDAGINTEMTSDITGGSEEDSEPETFRVKFVVGGRLRRFVDMESGQPVKKPRTDPKLDGYAFMFWWVAQEDAECEPYDFDLPLEAPLVLTAFFVRLPEEAADAEDFEPNPIDMNDPAEEANDQDDHQPDDEEGIAESEETETPEPMITEDTYDGEKEEAEELLDDIEPDDPDEEEALAEAEALAAARWIYVYTDAPDIVRKGQIITLYSELMGYEDCVLSLRWQRSIDGNTWVDVTGGTGYSYSFSASKELVGSLWRLAVTILDEPLI